MDSYKRLNYYRLTPDEVCDQLNSSRTGLTSADARNRLQHLGPNILHTEKRVHPLRIFLRQFKSLFVLILVISACLAIYLKDGKTASILLIIAFINAAVGYFQEHKAESLLHDLEQLVEPRAKVFRDGKLLRYDKKTRTPEMDYIDYGVALLRREAAERIPADRPFDLAELYTALVLEGRMIGYEVTNRFYEIGTPAALEETALYLASSGR